jgi:hypothetical protein
MLSDTCFTFLQADGLETPIKHRRIKKYTAMRCCSSSRRESYVSHFQPHKDFISAIL